MSVDSPTGTYAEVENDTIVNTVSCDADFASEQGLVDIGDCDPMPGIDWTTADQGATWTPPAPTPQEVAVTQATTLLASLQAQQAAFATQIAADADMWAATKPGTTLTQPQIDALVRLTKRATVVLNALVAQMTVNAGA